MNGVETGNGRAHRPARSLLRTEIPHTMFTQSNPLAVMAIVSLASAIVYEWRYDIRLGLDWLVMQAVTAVRLLLCFWPLALVYALGYVIYLLDWRWLLVGIARICGAVVILYVVFLIWTEAVRPLAQKLSRQWTR